jgi:hypothetical protein
MSTNLEKLVHEYFHMEYKSPIENHLKLLKVFFLKNTGIYISRRSLKHFVESRKKELLVNHTKERALASIIFAVRHISETITQFDSYKTQYPNRYLYTKDYSSTGSPRLRIILETVDNHLEIVSIHFKRIRGK